MLLAQLNYETGHGGSSGSLQSQLSCHRQQSADQSADRLLPIQQAKLVKGALLKLL